MDQIVNFLILAMWTILFGYWGLSALRTNKTERAEVPVSRWIHLSMMTLSFLLTLTDLFRFGILGQRFLPDNLIITVLGLVITAMGTGFAIWARYQLGRYWSGNISIKADHKLVRSGAYAFSRHPIYTGLIFGMLGSAIAIGEWRGLIAFLLMLIAYARKIQIEECWLVSEFGDEYEDYRHHVKSLIPFVL